MTSCRALAWCFTLNNPSKEELDLPLAWEGTKYLVFQLEEGDSGTPHIQGYVSFTKRCSLSTLKALFPRAHWEVAKGSADQNKKYCTKEPRLAGPFEMGKAPAPGKRNDLDEVKASLDGGMSILDLTDQYFASCAKNLRFFERYKMLHTPPRCEKTKCRVLWGPTGTGKSHTANTEYPGAYWKCHGNWWDGYCGQETVVIDEFYGWLSYSFMLRLLDKYPLIVETKGGHVSFTSAMVVITSNKHPKDWYDPITCPYAPLERRLESITQIQPQPARLYFFFFFFFFFTRS